MTKFKLLALAATMSCAAMSAQAATSSATLTVGATVLNVCVIGDSIMLFGNLGMVTTALGLTSTTASDAQTLVPVLCSSGTAATIEGDLGLHASGTERRMKQLLGTSMLPYTLYKDAGRTQVFGGGTSAVSYTGTGLPDLLPLYGRITGPAINGAQSGAYLDSVGITLTYTP